MKKRILIFSLLTIFTISILIGLIIALYSKIHLKKVEGKYMEIANRVIDIEEKESEVITKEELKLNEYVIGILEIPKIDVKAPVRDGTTDDILTDSIGHFKNTSYWNGNVGFASHNSGNFVSHYFENLDKLIIGDTITYKTKFGERSYKVTEIKNIDSKDWSEMANTKENSLTLITCIKNKPDLRLCIKAIEK